MNWIKSPVILEGERVKLVPLHQDHFPALAEVARHRDIWHHLPLDGSDEHTLLTNLRTAILKRGYGEQYPFTVIDKISDKIYGSTRLFEIYPEHKKLEIGWTCLLGQRLQYRVQAATAHLLLRNAWYHSGAVENKKYQPSQPGRHTEDRC